MKLHYISHWRFPSEKTMSPLIMRTCEEFSNQGVEVKLVVPRRDVSEYRSEDPFTYHGVKENFGIERLWVLDLIKSIGGNFSFILILLSFNISLFIYALRNKDGVYYIHDHRDAILLSFLNRKIVLEIHDFYQSRFNAINKRVFKKAYKFIVTNQYKIDVISSKYDIPKEKFLHKPNAVNIQMFDIDISKEEAREKIGLPQDKKIVLYAGHLFDWKGVDTLLEAHRFLKDFGIYFVGGIKSDLESMREKSQKMGASNAHFLGLKPHTEIPFYYKSADVLVLPNTAKMDVSKYETSPVKIFEYMASKRPIIASDIPSVRNIVNEDMVWFFEADNPENLAEKVKTVIVEGSSSGEKVSKAFEEVRGHTWEKRVNRIKNFIL